MNHIDVDDFIDFEELERLREEQRPKYTENYIQLPVPTYDMELEPKEIEPVSTVIIFDL